MAIQKEKIKQLDDGSYLNSNNEILKDREFVTMLVPRKERWNRGEYMLSLQKSFLDISKMDLTGEQFKVLMLLMAKTDFENYIHITQSDMANELSIAQQNVSKAINALVKKNIIKRMKKGTSNYYLFNPEISYKGKSKNYGNVLSLFKD